MYRHFRFKIYKEIEMQGTNTAIQTRKKVSIVLTNTYLAYFKFRLTSRLVMLIVGYYNLKILS